MASLIAKEDFIIHDHDGLFTYNLAVVVDDHLQEIKVKLLEMQI